jgi:hypothetical protein
MSALIRWLPELAVATAKDIERFGPQAARVRSMLDFLPTMSLDAQRVGEKAALRARTRLNENVSDDDYWYNALDVADRTTQKANRIPFMTEAWNDMLDAFPDAMHMSGAGLQGAAYGEVASDLITPNTYRVLTNPLAASRAVDVLSKRYKNTPFRELLGELGSSLRIAQPSDVLRVGRVAALPDEVARQEIVDLVKNYGMTLEEAINVIRMV